MVICVKFVLAEEMQMIMKCNTHILILKLYVKY